MRVVLDTNILVSALLSSAGPPADLLRGWRDGRLELVVSERLLEELEAVLLRPRFRARFTTEQGTRFVGALRSSAEVVGDPEVTERLAPDPDDDFLVALAVASDVDALVSGDLALRGAGDLRVPVLSARELLELLDRMEP